MFIITFFVQNLSSSSVTPESERGLDSAHGCSENQKVVKFSALKKARYDTSKKGSVFSPQKDLIWLTKAANMA